MKQRSALLFFLAVVAGTVLLSSTAHADAEVDAYRNAAKELIDRVSVSGQDLDSADVLRRADRLAEMGVDILRHHKEMDPECAPVLDVFIEELPRMKSATPAEMDRLYHQGELLIEKGLEIDPYDYAYESCMELTHLITHPAAVPVQVRAFEADGDVKHLRSLKEELVRLHHHLEAHLHE